MTTEISHTERMRVNWVDTDGSGLIHYTASLRYFETAEHALMRKLFPDRATPGSARGFMMPRVHVECDYRAPLRYPDEFDCTARIEKVGTSSVTYAYEVRRLDGVVTQVGRIVAVAVGEGGESMSLPDWFREGLSGSGQPA